ncbi:hypothetical protein Goari_002698, partial [Gossypium aridum]|nr:hypothetical protein [Gossypium aridum]
AGFGVLQTNFCLPPEEPTIIPVVQELNLALKEREATRPYYELQTSVKVKGVNILLTDRSICQFYDASIWPTADLFDMSPVQAIQVYAILQKKQISIGTWIYRNMIAFVKNQAKGTFFSYLIMELCKKVRVPMERMDKEMNPPKKLLAVCNFTEKTKGREEKNRTPGGR